MKQLRKLFFTALVLLAAGGLVYTLSLDPSTPVAPVVDLDDETTTLALADEIDPSAILDITYAVGDTQLHFALGADDHWIWQDDTSFPLDDTYILQLVSAVESLSYQRSIPFTDDNTIANYGLDNPWGSLVAVYGDGSTLTLDFGDQSTDDTTCYMLKNQDDTAALVYDSSWMDVMSIPIYDMMSLPTLPTFTASTVQWISIVGETPVLLNTADQGQSWYTTDVSITTQHPDLMTAITEIELVKCFIYAPSAEAATICGFDEPVATVTIDYSPANQDEDTLTLFFGTISTDEAYRYVRLLDDETIYLLDEGIYQVFSDILTEYST